DRRNVVAVLVRAKNPADTPPEPWAHPYTIKAHTIIGGPYLERKWTVSTLSEPKYRPGVCPVCHGSIGAPVVCLRLVGDHAHKPRLNERPFVRCRPIVSDWGHVCDRGRPR